MKYRNFGSTGFNVSALGLGCMRLPTQRFRIQKINVPKAVELIRASVDKGINYMDTGLPYHLGESERVLGQALAGGYREKVHLVTKLPMFLVNRESDFDKYLDRQLSKLKTDYLDTYLFHALNRGGFEKLKKFNMIEKMLAAQKAGRIKYIGFSFHDTLPVFREIVDYFSWDVVQIQYNYMDTGAQATTEGLKYAAGKGMAVVIMEPLKGGMLANPPAEALSVLEKSDIKRSPVDWALQYLWNRPEVSVVISGMGNMRMLTENCESADRSGVGILTGDELGTINELIEIYRKNIIVPCTACQYCMPCSYGVNIPQNFAYLNNMASRNAFFHNVPIRWNFRKLVRSTKKLNAEKTNGNAVLCTECGVCVKKCPQFINIPEELKKVNAAAGREKKEVQQS